MLVGRDGELRGAPERVQMPVKLNTIDYPRILKVMEQTGYGGFVTVEYCYEDWRRCNEADVVSETILMRDLLRSVAA